MSGFTSLGFSKSGFSCCGHWQHCQMGTLECYYDHIDPEVKNYCRCFNNAKKHPEKEIKNIDVFETKGEQLSLF